MGNTISIKCSHLGLRSAPSIFNQLSDAIEWILQNDCMISFVCHILDDFLIIEPPAPTVPLDSLCQASLSSMILSFKNLNIPISAAKTGGPCKVLQFVGIILDSHKMDARLPVDKVERIKTTLCELDPSDRRPGKSSIPLSVLYILPVR